MRRKGFSLSMNYAVVGLIALTVAFLAVTIFTGNARSVGDIISGSIDQSTKNFAEEQCVIEKRRLCDLEQYGGGCEDNPNQKKCRNWAPAAEVQGKTCYEWIDKHSVLGGQIPVVPCGQSYEKGLDENSDGGGGGEDTVPPSFGDRPEG